MIGYIATKYCKAWAQTQHGGINVIGHSNCALQRHRLGLNCPKLKTCRVLRAEVELVEGVHFACRPLA